MRVCILIADSNGGYPVPASKGGAVATLIEHIVKENDYNKMIDLTIVTFYDEKAFERSKQYPNVKFLWIKTPYFVKCLDRITFSFAKKCFGYAKIISYRTIWSLIYYIFKSSSLLKRKSFDWVILENNIPLAWTIKLSKYKGKYCYHLHNIPRISAGASSVFKNCKYYLCVSEYVGSRIKSNECPIGPIEKDKIKILYNCVDDKLFSPSYEKGNLIREKYNIKQDEKLVLFAGRLSKEKGVDILLRAMTIAKDVRTKLIVVGSLAQGSNEESEYEKELKKYVSELRERVYFTGYVDQENMADYYSAADIAVLPSMWDEPAGLTMIESMSCGTAVVSTISGGIPEYVGECGILLKRSDDIAEKIAELIDNLPSGRYSIADNKSRERIKENFSSKIFYDAFCEILSD